MSGKEYEIYDPKYLKCKQKVTVLSATEIGSVLVRLVYSFSSLIFLLSMESVCLTDTLYLSLLVSGTMLFYPQNLGGRENTHSVLDALGPLPICISNPNFLN